MFAAYWHRSEPMKAVSRLSGYDAVKLLLNAFRKRPDCALAHADLVNRPHRSDFGGRSSEENFLGEIQHLARNALFDNGNVQILGDGQDGVAGDAGQNGIPQRRSLQDAVAHNEYVFTGPLADVTVRIQSDSLSIAIHDSFHFDQLGVHIVGAGFGHGGERVGGDSGPAETQTSTPCSASLPRYFPQG